MSERRIASSFRVDVLIREGEGLRGYSVVRRLDP